MKKILLPFLTVLTLALAGMFITEEKAAQAASTKISSAEDLLAMEKNPSGDYYLAKDINVPANTCLFSEDNPFTGTLDGKGYKLNGYKSTEACGIFAKAKSAKFEDIAVTNVDINVNGSVAALVCYADSCDFTNVTVSGTIVSTGGNSSSEYVGAIAAYGSGKMEKCNNSAKITAYANKRGKYVGGLAGWFKATSLKNCSNSGAVTLNTITDTYNFAWKGDEDVQLQMAGLVAQDVGTVTSCQNSGNITLNLKYKVDEQNLDFRNRITVYVGGICKSATKLISSGNTGKVKVTSKNSAKIYGSACVGGVAAYMTALAKNPPSKCYNKGEVSLTGAFDGKAGFGAAQDCKMGGLFGWSYGMRECYNTGKVSLSLLSNHTGSISFGGLAGECNRSLINCYNAGKVTVKNKGKRKKSAFRVGGLCGSVHVAGGKATCNYNTGVVNVPKDCNNHRYHGQLIGEWAGPFLADKSLIYNNYYTTSGKAYGAGDTGWKPYMPTASKVSSIKSGSCPKLSSKYWVYSSKHKRLILKKNKEK